MMDAVNVDRINVDPSPATTDTRGMDLIDGPAGLNGVAVADTAIGTVLGDEGFYHYRDHDAVDLRHLFQTGGIGAVLRHAPGRHRPTRADQRRVERPQVRSVS